MRSMYTITFYSDWQIASGVGDGYLADSYLCRDAEGFLYLPGRAVKGALREGAHRLGLARPDLAQCETLFFGSRSQGEGFNKSGALTVGEAKLPEEVLSALRAVNPAERAIFMRDLTLLRSQTALENGTAKNASLRTQECGIAGMTFEGTLEVTTRLFMTSEQQCPDEAWLKGYLAAVCAASKSMGSGRSRGLGQCTIALAASATQVVSLPASFPVNVSRRV